MASFSLWPLADLAARTQADAEDGAEEGIIVRFKPGVEAAKKRDKHSRRYARETGSIAKLDTDTVKVKKADRASVISSYRSDPDVLYAEPDFIAKAFSVTNDPSLKSSWGVFKVSAASNTGKSAWDLARGNNVRVAVLDTGIDSTHPDLAGKIVASKNFSQSSSLGDMAGHGTHVAGIIAANADNGLGVAGVAYSASLMNVKVLGDDGSGSYSSIVNGIIWAADNGAKVINMSLGAPYSSQALADAVNYAWSKGVVVVAAAGNDGTSAANYPAYYSNAIAVAATDSSDSRAGWSNYGSWVDAAAPGSSIYSTYKGNAYATLSGTSMATPFVAGIAALVWSKGDCTTNSCVRSKIEQTADKINGTGSSWANGRVNAFTAVGGTAVNPVSPVNPTPTIPQNPAANTVSSAISMTYAPYYWNYRTVNLVINIKDKNNIAVSSANVSLKLTTPSGRTVTGSGMTGANGVTSFRYNTSELGNFRTNIINVTKNGYAWSGSNASASLTVK